MGKRLYSGIYRVYDRANGRSFVGFSLNVEGTLKRLRFELVLNACSYKPLQQFFNSAAEPDMELLEEYSPGPEESLTPEEREAHMMARLFCWREKLGAELIQSQVIA